MYLLVFATLVISMMSVYTQVLAVEAARLAANQTGIAQAMTSWHNAAVSMAASVIDTAPNYSTVSGPGCSLSWDAPNNLSRCPSPINMKTSVEINGTNGTPPYCQTKRGTVVDGPGNNNVPCGIYNAYNQVSELVHLTPGYSADTYEFSSAVYRDGATGIDYVVTFVPPAVISGGNPSGFLTLANGTQLGVTSGDLMTQLKRAGVSGSMLGTVLNGALITGGQSINNNGVGFSFLLPTNGVSPLAPDGSIGIISSPDGF